MNMCGDKRCWLTIIIPIHGVRLCVNNSVCSYVCFTPDECQVLQVSEPTRSCLPTYRRSTTKWCQRLSVTRLEWHSTTSLYWLMSGININGLLICVLFFLILLFLNIYHNISCLLINKFYFFYLYLFYKILLNADLIF